MSNNNAMVIVENVQSKINTLVEKGDVVLPEGYAAGNALREAYLILREAVDRNKRPVLEVCTQESIALALLNMTVMGFYPARGHAYFIPYGQKLTMMPSYLGKMMLAKRLNPHVREITAELIYDGDEIEISLVNGKKSVTSHKQQFKTPSIEIIAGAYAMAIGNNGDIIQTVVMTKDEIMRSWKQSRQKPFDDKGKVKTSTVHYKFPGEMCKRTAINRLCKGLVSTAIEPSSFLDNAIQEIEIEATENELDAAIEANAGMVAIGFPEQEAEPEKPAPKRRSPRKKKAEEIKPPIPEVKMEIDDSKVEVTQEEDPFAGEDLPNPDDIPNQPEGDPFEPGF